MGYRPKHQTQLGRGPTDGRTDCNVRAYQMGSDWATRGSWVPGIRVIRERMERNLYSGTNLYDSKKAASSMGIPFNVKAGVGRDIPKRALKNGKPVVMSISYRVLNQRQPNKSGDPNFTGLHGVYVQGFRLRPDGKRVAILFDSLYDGRRNSIPRGPQWVLYSTLVAASRAYGKLAGANGMWVGIFSKKPNTRSLAARDVGYASDDDTELLLSDVEAQRNDLTVVAADVDFFDAIIDNPETPAVVRLEAQAKRALSRSVIGEDADDPYATAGEGLTLPTDADGLALSDDDVEELLRDAEIEEEEDNDEEDGE